MPSFPDILPDMELPKNTWFVIAAYNEGKRIGRVLEELSAITPNIVVVDDCSTDDTYDVCANFRCSLVRHPINLDQGGALQTGNEYALSQSAEIIIHFDGDGQMQLKDVPAMIAPIVNGQVDVTMGSRYVSGNNNVPTTKKIFIHRPAIYLQWFLTGLKLTDAHCGFRAFSRAAADKCVIRQNRKAHATEIIELVARNGLRYCEVPVEISYAHYGQNFRKGFVILRDIFISKLSK